ncbi:MAG: helicase-exonuclease AddAB subunit AddA [Lachnospiraceae bacterium]|nr:helicase-exonuclease AddAB subunit AddA [Lachnospiraceae bacterium]
MSISFTEEQQKVIDIHGCNLLVSAAAGSGKTAVLVERIVKMVSDEEHPVDIDRLLIVTFTNAAAAEMRERISNAIGEKLAKEPENEHLQRQSALLHNAQITTIDSFCLFVIRNQFHTIGLDPGFRIADEGERKLLRQDVLSDVLEQCYQQGDEAFLRCMEYFSTGSRDKAVEDAVLKLYDFAMSYPFPREWLLARKEDYKDSGEASWMRELMEHTTLLLQGMIDQLSQCIAACEEPDGPYMYGALLEAEKEKLEKLAATKSYEERYVAFEKMEFGRLLSKKDETVSVVKREMVKSARTDIKEQIQKMQQEFFACSEEEIRRQAAVCQEAVSALVDLTLLFLEAFDDAKRAKNLLDFDDIEHFALSILVEKKENGDFGPTATALEYRSHFTEILIDEYQDSNLVQEYLLSAISGEEDGCFNRFMVGDVKQSIYKFRLARPELFLEKYHMYGTEEGKDTLRIDLHKNFRSREEVLTSTNAVFSRVMRQELGGITYDAAAALYPGAVYPENVCHGEAGWEEAASLADDGNGNNTELLLFDEVEEARGIAQKIKQLMVSFQVTDKETGTLRKVCYKDIVILLRTTTGWDEEFKQVLEEEGIPVHVSSKTGYFAATEVQELLHFLRVLDNPLQDIPFYGVMHSYFGGFSEEEIARIKAACPKKRYLYDAAAEYATAGNAATECASSEREGMESCSLQEKMQAFLARIEGYREQAVYLSVHELLQTIIREYSYLSYVAARPGGSKRRANVEMLLVKASDYEKTSYFGLYHFLRYIEQLQKYDVDYGEANLQDENADVVRIMSIHKSKGLEFPVCIVAGLAKGFNNRDTNERLVLDVDLGIGVDYVNPEMRVHSRNIRRNFIASKMRQDNLAEELRILYVAMTRAKEKLILTGVLKNPEKKTASMKMLSRRKETVFSYHTLMQMGSFLDVILAASAGNKCFDVVWEAYGERADQAIRQNPLYEEDMKLQVILLKAEDMLCSEIKETVVKEGARQRLVMAESGQGIDRKLMQKMTEKFSYQYPYENLRELYTKTTVSELKKAGMQEEQDFSFSLYEEEPIVPYLPKFIKQEEKVSGTDRGSAFHKVMELFDFKSLLSMNTDDKETMHKNVLRAMDEMRQEGKLSEAYYTAVSIPKIVHFLQSNVAKRMAQADERGRLYKEQPFVLGLPANRLRESFPEEETVLIQGIIDVFFEENGNYVVLDYKTDAVDAPEDLIKRYQVQLAYYTEALEQLSGYKFTGKGLQVAEKIIYSFRLEKEIRVE